MGYGHRHTWAQKKIVGRGRRKSVTGWEVKISPPRGGQFEEQGGGTFKKARKQCFCAKKHNFLTVKKMKIS